MKYVKITLLCIGAIVLLSITKKHLIDLPEFLVGFWVCIVFYESKKWF